MQVEATALQRLWRSHSLGSCISASVVVSSPSSTRRHCSCISDVTSKLSYGQRLQHFSLRRSNQRSKITEKSTSEEAAQRTVYSVARRISAVLRESTDVPMLAKLPEDRRSSWVESEHDLQTYPLEERSLLVTEPTMVTTKDGCKRNGNLLSTIRPIQAALQQDYDRQMQKLDEDAARRKYADFIQNTG